MSINKKLHFLYLFITILFISFSFYGCSDQNQALAKKNFSTNQDCYDIFYDLVDTNFNDLSHGELISLANEINKNNNKIKIISQTQGEVNAKIDDKLYEISRGNYHAVLLTTESEMTSTGFYRLYVMHVGSHKFTTVAGFEKELPLFVEARKNEIEDYRKFEGSLLVALEAIRVAVAAKTLPSQ
jgi:hypothetical protein